MAPSPDGAGSQAIGENTQCDGRTEYGRLDRGPADVLGTIGARVVITPRQA
jgi:hypothetical protein